MKIKMGFVENELKNAYIGEYKNYEYSYNFVGKTTSSMEADGWEFIRNKSYATFNSNGMNSTTQDKEVGVKIENLASIMPGAKKVTTSFTGMFNGRLRAWVGLYNTLTDSTTNGVTGPSATAAENRITTTIYSNDTYTSTTPSGEITLTTVVDLENGTWQTTGSNGYANSGTITAANITNIRNGSKGFGCTCSRGGGGNSSGGVKNMSLKIER